MIQFCGLVVGAEMYLPHSIVAIHGLDGYREESWTAKNNVLWLRDLLPSEIPAARILTYGYDANTRGKEQLNNQTLFDHAETLILKLVMFRKKTLVRTVIISEIPSAHRICFRQRTGRLYLWPIVSAESSSNT
jgi:hypothetical protein